MRPEPASIDDPRLKGMQAFAGAADIGAAELRMRTGISPCLGDELFPGVFIRYEAYPCRLGDGFVFSVLRGVEGDAAGEVEIWTHRADQIAIVALALGLPDGWFHWRSASDPETDRPWRVDRQDDNGNTFELARFADRDDAALYARLWDDRIGAHKQAAFVERR